MPRSALTYGSRTTARCRRPRQAGLWGCGLWAALGSPMAAGTGPPDVWVVKSSGDGGLVQVRETPTDPEQRPSKAGPGPR